MVSVAVSQSFFFPLLTLSLSFHSLNLFSSLLYFFLFYSSPFIYILFYSFLLFSIRFFSTLLFTLPFPVLHTAQLARLSPLPALVTVQPLPLTGDQIMNIISYHIIPYQIISSYHSISYHIISYYIILYF